MRANQSALDAQGDDRRRIDYLPSPDEIADACQSIRKSWTLSEKRRRYVGDLMPDEPESAWRPPVIDTSGFRLATTSFVDSAN